MDGLFAVPCDLVEVLADFVLVRAGVEAVEELGALGYHGSRADGQVEARSVRFDSVAFLLRAGSHLLVWRFEDGALSSCLSEVRGVHLAAWRDKARALLREVIHGEAALDAFFDTMRKSAVLGVQLLGPMMRMRNVWFRNQRGRSLVLEGM